MVFLAISQPSPLIESIGPSRVESIPIFRFRKIANALLGCVFFFPTATGVIDWPCWLVREIFVCFCFLALLVKISASKIQKLLTLHLTAQTTGLVSFDRDHDQFMKNQTIRHCTRNTLKTPVKPKIASLARFDRQKFVWPNKQDPRTQNSASSS